MTIRRILQLGLIAWVIYSSFAQSISYLISTKERGSLGQDPVTQWETKFVRLKNALPTGTAVVGYLADWDVPGIPYDDGNQHGEYVLIQYTLSPVILTRGMEHEWIVGNLTHEAYEKWQSSAQGNFEVSFFKNNLYLIHKVKP
jgi:hypothetical protein